MKGCDYSNIQIFECKQKRVFTIEHIIKALRKLPFEDAEQTTSFVIPFFNQQEIDMRIA